METTTTTTSTTMGGRKIKRSPSLIVGYGEFTVFEKLVARINHEFKTNPRYQRSVNSIDIRMRADTTDTVFDIVIDTKYYTFECELHVASNEKDLRTKLLEKRASNTIEGLIVALDYNSSTTAINVPAPHFIKSAVNMAEFKETFVDSETGGLNVLVHVGTGDPHVKKTAKQELEKIGDEILEFELYLDNTATATAAQVNNKNGVDNEEEEEEEDFSALDELINCLFVHNWVNMNRKDTFSSHTTKQLNGIVNYMSIV